MVVVFNLATKDHLKAEPGTYQLAPCQEFSLFKIFKAGMWKLGLPILEKLQRVEACRQLAGSTW